jgi:hypothetical protein
MRRSANLFLSLSLSISLAVPALASQWEPVSESLVKNQEVLEKVLVQNPHFKPVTPVMKGVEAFSHPLQTMMLIWILAGVETYRQQNHLGPLNDQPMDQAQLLHIADLIFNDMEIYAGMAGASATGLALTKPLQELQQVLQNKVSRKLFAEFIQSGVASFVTFVGWEASSQLWKEAIYQLPTAEIQTAENLKFLKVFTLQASSEETQVFKEILSNAFKILTLQRPAQTRDWIYNTWRLRLATGDFLTLVTGMVTGSVIAGSVVAPGAGSLAGFCVGTLGGLIGGGLTLVLPQSWKDSITSTLRVMRMNYNNRSLGTYALYLKQVGVKFKNNQDRKLIPQEYQVENRKQQMEWVFRERRAHRNAAFTAAFEEIYTAKVKLQDALMLKILAEEKLKSEPRNEKLKSLIGEAEAVIQDAKEHMKDSFSAIFNQIDRERESFRQLLTDSELFYPQSFKDLFYEQISLLSNLKTQIQLIAQGADENLFPFFDLSTTELERTRQLSNNYLNISYERGFDEAWFDE